MKAKRGKWYWVEYKTKSKRAYIGPAKSISGMWKPVERDYFQGSFWLPSGAVAYFQDKDIVREVTKECVEENFPSYDKLLEFWRKHESA